MCVVSMVHDHYYNPFQDWEKRIQQYTYTPTTTFTQTVALKELRDLIKEFRELVASAKKIDEVTGQPDCVDPEKAKLENRVAALEAKMAKLAELGK